MNDDTKSKSVIIFRDAAGKEPFTNWINSLRDPTTRRRTLKRLIRLENGQFGDFKRLGGGISELRFFFGSGYRVYFGEDGDLIVIILCGGEKDSQDRDIQLAKAYWKEYLEND